MGEFWIDLSYPLSADTPPFPGDPAVKIEILDATQECSNRPRLHLNCSRLSTCVHCGTHMDAPFHFFGNGDTIDRVDLATCAGEARLINVEGRLPQTANAAIDAALLSADLDGLGGVERLIIRTGWAGHWGQPEYFTDHPVLTGDAAHLMVTRGVRLIGIDTPSVDRPPHAAHLELLGQGVLIVENLAGLDRLPDGPFEFFAVPLAIAGIDGSPVRAVARVKEIA